MAIVEFVVPAESDYAKAGVCITLFEAYPNVPSELRVETVDGTARYGRYKSCDAQGLRIVLPDGWEDSFRWDHVAKVTYVGEVRP